MEGGLWVDVEGQRAGHGNRVLPLRPQEVAMLAALAASGGRVVTRTELVRCAGLHQASSRRADSMLVSLRRALGEGALRNIRGRGWMLDPDAISLPAVIPIDR